ncbi:transposase family protein [Halotia branconii]|uniref:Transposase family protein n=1 Tax=Halotia branconii CENA392 TaxID=1539056 RepID=A0AAJ6NRG5_9CYAN|nr:transposase family protein [Halotia branconii]WGV25369.1 transposase family protein [Halotia branconii CENA392]
MREILLASQIEEASVDSQKSHELQRMLSEYELIIDSAKQAIARPVDYQEQKRYYSGNKKMRTLKNQFIILPSGEDIVDIWVRMLGKTSDINLFRVTQNKFADSQRLIGDKAYIWR